MICYSSAGLAGARKIVDLLSKWADTWKEERLLSMFEEIELTAKDPSLAQGDKLISLCRSILWFLNS